MTDKNVLFALAEQFLLALDPLRNAFEDSERFSQLLRRHSWVVAPETLDIVQVQNLLGVSNSLENADSLLDQTFAATPTDLLELYPKIFDTIRQIFTALRDLTDFSPNALLPFPFGETAFWSEFPNSLLNDLIVSYLKLHQPALYAPFLLFGIVEERNQSIASVPGRISYTQRIFHAERLGQLFNPQQLLRDVYQWDSLPVPFAYDTFMQSLFSVVEAMGFSAALRTPDEELLNRYYAADNPVRPQIRELRVPLVGGMKEGESELFELRLSTLPIPAAGDQAGTPVGLMISPSLLGTLPTIDFAPLHLVLRGGFELNQGIRLEIRPQQTTAQLLDPTATTVDAELGLLYTFDSPLVLVGDVTSDYIQLAGYGAFLRVTGAVAAVQFLFGAALEKLELFFDIGAAFAGGRSLILTLSWERLAFLWGNGDRFDFAIEFSHLRLANSVFPDLKIDVDLRLIAKDGKLHVDSGTQRASSALADTRTAADDALPNLLSEGFKLYEPALPGILPNNVHLDGDCLAIQWQDNNPDSWLNQLVPDFLAEGSSTQSTVTAQVIWGRPIREIRLDWAFVDKARTFAVPGLIKFETPKEGFFSLLFGAGGRDLTRMSFGYTVLGSGIFTLSSNFAWEREADRELHNDANEQSPTNPLFQLKLTAPTKGATLILADFDLAVPTIDGFFLEPNEPLSQLKIEDRTTLCLPVESLTGFSGDGWSASLTINYGQLQLPFLKQGNNQFVDVFDPREEANTNPGDTSFTISNITLDGDNSIIEIPLGLRLKLGDLNITTVFAAEFNWRTLSLHVDHEGGTHLYATKAVLDQDFLGLHWKFIGQLETSGPNQGKYLLFTLITKNYNYQIQQAAGSKIEISYDGISSDPIVFQVTDFAISDKGLNLRTTVVDAPVRLNGLDTKFRFDGSGIVIENSQIQSFTIAGSGALPPDLVGDSRASIALQFGRLADGNLTLVSGEAKLEGNNLLHCQGTRFQFSVDALGLKFVNDGKFHLYFTITGSAQFVLGDGDDREGALALLPKIKIDLIEVPLTGDVSVIGKHIKFLVELPKPVSFSFLGCFEMELRGIGFEPQAEVFGGDGAMLVSGQLKFAQGGGDIIDARIDLHNLHIGLPERGSFVPRVYFKGLSVSLAISGAFKLNAVVDFIDGEREKGFTGEGMVDIQGLPSMAGAFGFLRVRHNETSPWLRAWFIYLEVRKVSFVIPVVQIYLREVGLGFGYRYTLASIKAADQEGDIRKLLKELRTLSRTQGDLSKRDRWAVDLEAPGQDPRWTIVLRAMIAQTSASAPWTYSESSEKELACIYLFDAVIAFRSDFTFFMAVRGWFNTNYNDFLTDNQGLRNKPLISGFVLLAPRQKRFLAHVSSNPDGKVGPHPPLPDFVKTAIESAEFSATLLIEPGLLHYEMGWPNMLRWKGKLGPLQVEFQGGFIFRISKTELVTGTSFMARGTIDMEAGFSAGIFGVSVSLYAQVAYGARYIGVLAFKDVTQNSAFYGAIGLELYIRITIKFWIKLLFIKKTFRFSISVGFTAALEIGIKGNLEPGIRGQGTVSLKAMGRSIRFGVKVGINTGAVDEALARTNKFLNIGLESTEVEALPGLNPQEAGTRALPRAADLFVARALAAALPVTAGVGAAPSVTGLTMPNYSLFVVRLSDQECYFVLLPAGERAQNGNFTPETGFLPTPPTVAVDHDFMLAFATPGAPPGDVTVRQYVPENAGGWQLRTETVMGGSFGWRVNWSAQVISDQDVQNFSTNPREVGQAPTGAPMAQPQAISLADYMESAFLKVGDALSDPDPVDEGAAMQDERVQNPSDSAFEAAVRGAFEQFRGSPFFKRDPNHSYDRALEEAFSQNTNIYPGADVETAAHQEQADQVRGLIVHDLIADLQEFVEQVALLNNPTDAQIDELTRHFAGTKLGFQMGLVFRVKGKRPDWLDSLATATSAAPTIRQRLDVGAVSPGEETGTIRPFNTPRTSFKTNPPRFDRVRHYTNSTTVGITWDLVWDGPPASGCTPCQAEPEHHLLNYEVRRRALDSQERDAIFTVKSGEVLHRGAESGGIVQRLRPRFQLVDNFDDLTAGELARLPARGLSYLYTITPIDFAKNRGRPLTVVATRYPDAPPGVPTNGELTVAYRLDRATTLAQDLAEPTVPAVVEPEQLHIQWTEPRVRSNGADAPIRDYQLIFRREATLPIGSYGLDSTTQRDKVKALPTTNARTRPTDIIVPIERGAIQPIPAPAGIEGVQHNRVALISLQTLRDLRIFPSATKPQWRPEAWRIFFRTVSDGDVPSALAPVQLKLRVNAALPETPVFKPLPEERRPAELEWLPHSIRLPLLPAVDQKAITGDAHFPMPRVTGTVISEANAATWRFVGNVTEVAYQPHPAGIRAIRFRWNQAPSNQPDYPLNLSAGYELLELDIDAHTNATLHNAKLLADVLRPIQEVQMLPADDLIVTPGDTLLTNQWEAWYISSQLRRNGRAALQQSKTPIAGSETSFGPWFSWRESLLVWPAWSALETGPRTSVLHPFLESLITKLEITADDPADVQDKYIVDRQGMPPLQPMTFTDFRRATAPSSDPYGWGVLQRFGLSLTLSLRKDGSSDLVTDDDLLQAIQKAIMVMLPLAGDPLLAKHLHVELLFQAGASIALKTEKASSKGLLGLVQISLRPVPIQYLRYSSIQLRGPAGAEIELVINLVSDSCTLIEQANVAGRGQQAKPNPGEKQIELKNKGEPIIHRITLPLNGVTQVLLRSTALFSANLPATNGIGLRLKLAKALNAETIGKLVEYPVVYVEVNPTQVYLLVKTMLSPQQRIGLRTLLGEENYVAFDQVASIDLQAPTEFDPTSEYATYFLTPVDQLIAAISQNSDSAQVEQWLRFKRYAESFNSSGRDEGTPTAEPRIVVPTTETELRDDNLLAQVLSWTQRFFDHGGPVLSLRSANVEGNGTAKTSKALLAAQLAGPWLATAYPRVGTPTYATPDAAGRLQYFHLLEDKWAHTYRYYIRPYGRYQQLWRNLSMSPLLWPPTEATDQDSIAPLLPTLAEGGLDVVLDRIKPVDMPTILRSGRLDPMNVPGQPATPGKLWEVIIAQHREQALSERNQTVNRQLSFRHVAYTLLRRFAYQKTWQAWQEKFLVGFDHSIDYPVSNDAELPSQVEPTFYNLDDPTTLSEDDLLRFALPRRVDTFQQGALVVQWEALPFYYEHRMLVIAQTTTQVSPVNSVVQRDFEYRAPEPADEPQSGHFCANFMEGEDVAAIRIVEIPLRRLWDSLPATVQKRWPDENPTQLVGQDVGRRPGLLPDPEVVYQIIEYFQGNIEVQAELYVDPASSNLVRAKYEKRQLGKRQLAEVVDLITSDGGESYRLRIRLQQPDDAGVIDWSNTVVLSRMQDPNLSGFTFTLLDNCRLVWPGAMTAAEAEALGQLPGDEQFKIGLARVAAAAQQVKEADKGPVQIATETIPPDPEQARNNLPAGWHYADFQLSGLPQGATLQLLAAPPPAEALEATHFATLRWTGMVLAAEQANLLAGLLAWAQLPELQRALGTLFATLRTRTVATPYSGELPADLPAMIQPQMQVAESSLHFVGLVQDETQRQALLALVADAAPFEETFKRAVRELLNQLQSTSVDIELNLPKRPNQAALPLLLRERLVIGRSLLRFNGIMRLATAKLAQTAVDEVADKNAVGRLYYQSVTAGLTGRTLRIRTRRGSAQPSLMRDLEPMKLDQPVEPVEGEVV